MRGHRRIAFIPGYIGGRIVCAGEEKYLFAFSGLEKSENHRRKEKPGRRENRTGFRIFRNRLKAEHDGGLLKF